MFLFFLLVKLTINWKQEWKSDDIASLKETDENYKIKAKQTFYPRSYKIHYINNLKFCLFYNSRLLFFLNL